MEAGILSLPNELIFRIISQPSLSNEDIHSLSQVCNRFKIVCECNSIWKSKFINKWPWIWNKISSEEKLVESWKDEALAVVTLSEKVNALLWQLRHDLFKFRNLTAPILRVINEFYCIGTFPKIYCLSELRDIFLEPGTKNLTKKYYASLVQKYIHHCISTDEWDKFFALPSKKQTLEQGAFYFAKWFQPTVFLDYELSELSSKLNDLAKESLAQLREKYPNHPATFHTLIKPEYDEELTECLWRTKEECEIIMECVNHVFFNVYKFKWNEDDTYVENTYINRVFVSKQGTPAVLSIMYHSVCHRLGIFMQPFCVNKQFFLKCKIPRSDDYLYIDLLKRGKRYSSSSACFLRDSRDAVNGVCSTHEVLIIMAASAISIVQRNLVTIESFSELCYASEISVLLRPEHESTLEFLYRIYLSFEIHVEKVIAGCVKLTEEKPHLIPRFKRFLEDGKAKLQVQMSGPKPVVIKEREPVDKVEFATGMIMRHKLYGYTCVIYGWDHTCTMPMDWIIEMNVQSLKYQQNQPFYNVLVGDGSQRYAAQENLVNTPPSMVRHKDLGKYFDQYDGIHYVPNDELASEYPGDKEVRLRSGNSDNQ